MAVSKRAWQKMKRKPYSLPLINEILQELGAFRYATCLDLNMGYYSMELDDESKKKGNDSNDSKKNGKGTEAERNNK